MEKRHRRPTEIDFLPEQLAIEKAEERVEYILEQWRKMPVYFASGSEKKIRTLTDAQMFGEVRSLTSLKAGDQERLDHNIFLRDYEDHLFALFKTEATMAVAEGKLRGLLREHDIPEDAFLLAVDTMPQFFPEMDPQGKEFNTKIEAISMERPLNNEAAARQIQYVFRSIIQGYLGLRNMIRMMREMMTKEEKSPQKIENTMSILWSGNLPSLIKVNTGVAIRFPRKERIDTFTEEVHVYPGILYDLVDSELGTVELESDEDCTAFIKKLEGNINDIVAQLLVLEGHKALEVSGGINYADPAVRSFLKLRVNKFPKFVPEEEVKPEWFEGLPVDAIKSHLARAARAVITS